MNLLSPQLWVGKFFVECFAGTWLSTVQCFQWIYLRWESEGLASIWAKLFGSAEWNNILVCLTTHVLWSYLQVFILAITARAASYHSSSPVPIIQILQFWGTGACHWQKSSTHEWGSVARGHVWSLAGPGSLEVVDVGVVGEDLHDAGVCSAHSVSHTTDSSLITVLAHCCPHTTQHHTRSGAISTGHCQVCRHETARWKEELSWCNAEKYIFTVQRRRGRTAGVSCIIFDLHFSWLHSYCLHVNSAPDTSQHILSYRTFQTTTLLHCSTNSVLTMNDNKIFIIMKYLNIKQLILHCQQDHGLGNN